jgi:transcriptional regulator with XRE-family HTH domain
VPVDSGIRSTPPETTSTSQQFDGAGLRKLREDFGWSRKLLSERTGLTISAIARLETNFRPPTEREIRLITEVLLNVLEEELDTAPPVSLIKQSPGGAVRSAEWNGYRRGDPVKIVSEAGTFRFLYHHVDDTQEYVEVYGPVYSRKKNPHAPARRSFKVTRVRRVKK